MPKYRIVLLVDDTRIDMVRKKVLAAFGQDISTQIEKVTKPESRTERFAEAEGSFDDAKSIVTDLKDEMEDWRDNMPDSLKNGDKFGEIEDAISALESLENELENIDWDVSFPSMM